MQQVVLGDPPAVLLQVREHVVLVVVHDGQGFLHAASRQGLLILVHCGQSQHELKQRKTNRKEFKK